jgi:hypothetical protein
MRRAILSVSDRNHIERLEEAGCRAMFQPALPIQAVTSESNQAKGRLRRRIEVLSQ